MARPAKDGPYSVYSGGLWVRIIVRSGAAAVGRNGTARRTRPLRSRQGLERARSAMLDITPKLGRRSCQRDRRRLCRTGVRRRSCQRTASAAEIGFAGRHQPPPCRDMACDDAEARRRRAGLRFHEAVGDVIAVKREGDARGPCATSLPYRAVWWSKIRTPGRFWRCRAGLTRRAPRSTAPPRRFASRDRASSRSSTRPRIGKWHDAGLDHRRRAVLRVSVCPARAINASAISPAANAGPQTMRWGVEQSRNLMTVRAASLTGMAKIVKTAARRRHRRLSGGAGDFARRRRYDRAAADQRLFHAGQPGPHC